MKKTLLFSALFFLFQIAIFAQSEPDPKTDYFIYELVSGQKYIGIEVEKTDTSVTIRLEDSSQISVPVSVLASKNPSLESYGKKWIHNPNATRYFYAPSGFGLKKGEGYFQNTLLLINSGSYGFTDYFTLGAGVELYTLFNAKPIYFLTPKLSFAVAKNLNAGVGALYLQAPQLLDEEDGASFSIFYGVGTIGNRENHFTLGLGYGYVGEELAQKPIFTFNGCVRLTKRFALVTENWTVPTGAENEYQTINSFGIRYMEPEFTVDISILGKNFLNGSKRFAVPFFNCVIPFGKKTYLK